MLAGQRLKPVVPANAGTQRLAGRPLRAAGFHANLPRPTFP